MEQILVVSIWIVAKEDRFVLLVVACTLSFQRAMVVIGLLLDRMVAFFGDNQDAVNGMEPANAVASVHWMVLVHEVAFVHEAPFVREVAFEHEAAFEDVAAFGDVVAFEDKLAMVDIALVVAAEEDMAVLDDNDNDAELLVVDVAVLVVAVVNHQMADWIVALIDPPSIHPLIH